MTVADKVLSEPPNQPEEAELRQRRPRRHDELEQLSNWPAEVSRSDLVAYFTLAAADRCWDPSHRGTVVGLVLPCSLRPRRAIETHVGGEHPTEGRGLRRMADRSATLDRDSEGPGR